MSKLSKKFLRMHAEFRKILGKFKINKIINK